MSIHFENESELEAFIDERVSVEVKAATAIDTDKINVNGKPFYIGPVMVLSDQDVTALKHHVLSSAGMGTVFASLIVTLSDPSIPLIWRACLLGGILTGLQGLLVGVSNIGIVAFETWSHHGRPIPSPRFCVVCIGRFCVSVSRHSVRFFLRSCESVWTWYVDAHTITLANGVTVWVDVYGTVVLDAPECDSEAS